MRVSKDSDDNRQVISIGNVALIEEDKVPKFCWTMGMVECLIYGKDDAARRAVVRVISKAVSKLYPIESIENEKKGNE